MGDFVTAENFLQHAEHYYRMQTPNNAESDNQQPSQSGPRDRGGNGAERGADGGATGSATPDGPQPETPGADPV